MKTREDPAALRGHGRPGASIAKLIRVGSSRDLRGDLGIAFLIEERRPIDPEREASPVTGADNAYKGPYVSCPYVS